MRYLLDTHIVLWILEDSDRITPTVRAILDDATNQFSVSHITLMEIAIKQKIGKLPEFSYGAHQLVERLKNDNLILVPISIMHIQYFQNLPFFPEHRDPFDRFILSTALAEGFTVISADKNFKLYSDVVSLLAC